MKFKGLEKTAVILATAVLVGFGIFLQHPNLKAEKSGTEVSFLNVGQGDATLIKTPNSHYILIDGGPDKKILGELGEVLPPNARTIDTVILSHPHADHVSGLNYVLDRYQVNHAYLTGVTYTSPEYIEFLKHIKEENILAKKSYVGQDFTLDGVDFKCLYPTTDISGQTFKDQNDTSSVMDISYTGKHILMLGDLSARLQEKNLRKEDLSFGFDILKVSHHGSKTGTSSKILEYIKPKYSVIMVGAGNNFGHPSQLTLGQLSGSLVRRTDLNGRIQFLINSAGVTLE